MPTILSSISDSTWVSRLLVNEYVGIRVTNVSGDEQSQFQGPSRFQLGRVLEVVQPENAGYFFHYAVIVRLESDMTLIRAVIQADGRDRDGIQILLPCRSDPDRLDGEEIPQRILSLMESMGHSFDRMGRRLDQVLDQLQRAAPPEISLEDMMYGPPLDQASLNAAVAAGMWGAAPEINLDALPIDTEESNVRGGSPETYEFPIQIRLVPTEDPPAVRELTVWDRLLEESDGEPV